MIVGTLTAPRFPLREATKAPLNRLLRAEVTWVFRRPRTWIALGLLAMVPVVIAIGVKLSGGTAGALISTLIGNGLVLPILGLSLTLTVLLPLVGAMWAGDALAGESAHGTLRGLMIAPVSRIRLLGVKAFGIATAIFAAALMVALTGLVTGLLTFGAHGMITLSGTTVSVGSALLRLLVAVGWVTVQVWAVAAIALAVSSCTDHPMVVMAATIAGAIVFGVVGTIPALSGIQPYLLTTGWTALQDVLRDPMPTDGLLHGLGVAACYLIVGLSATLARIATKDG